MPFAFAAPPQPPGYNVQLVAEGEASRFWRGGAPREPTVKALARAAAERGVSLTLVDHRRPPTLDDRSGRGARLYPQAEAALAEQLGARYLSLSALDRQFIPKLRAALKEGDVYMHCMYGVNRAGFATARFARAARRKVTRDGLGVRDWAQGDAFQARLEAAGKK